MIEKTALGRFAIYRKMEAEKFPVSMSLGDGAVAWLDSDVDEWMEERLKIRMIAA